MAITNTLYKLLRSLPVGSGSSLLEIGEANWYGDLDPQEAGLQRRDSLFEIAQEFYSRWFAPTRRVAVDGHGTATALRYNLNQPFDLGERFDVVINHGTAEHVFNIAQVFATMHQHCELGGWMIHDAPFMGWVDHGFYCLQPTLFFDVALTNCYEIHTVAVHECKSETVHYVESREHIAKLVNAGKIPNNSMLFVVLRKRVDLLFQFPMQGYYAQRLSEAGNVAWREQR